MKKTNQQEVPHINVASVEVNEKLFEIVNVKGTPMFAYIDDKKNISYTQKVIDSETKIEYHPQTGEEIRKKAILLPTAATIEPLIGDDGLQKTIEEIHSFIKQYCDLPHDYIQIATYYVLLSYFYQQVDQIPYLSFLGDTGTGKSRCKQVIGSLCYLPILASGGAKPAAIYRIIDKWGGTLLMDEADFGKSDEGAEMIKILNCGFEKHSPRIVCDREDPEKLIFNNSFCPKIIARRFEFKDKATESRCITHITKETRRKDILVVLPPSYYGDAEAIRNKLTTLKLAYYRKYSNPQTNILADLDIEPRLQQVFTSLALILAPFPVELKKFKQFLLVKQKELIDERGNTEEGCLIRAYCELKQNEYLTVNVVVERASELLGSDISIWVAGKKLKALGFKSKHKRSKDSLKDQRVLSIDDDLLEILEKRYIFDQNVDSVDSCDSNMGIHPPILELGTRDENATAGGVSTIAVAAVAAVAPSDILSQITRKPKSFEEIYEPLKILEVSEQILTQILQKLLQDGDIFQQRPGFYAKIE